MHFQSFPNEIDHINRVRSDNRIENLRAADSVINSHNRSKPNTNTSGHVSWHKRYKKWQAIIHSGNKTISLGRFDDIGRAVEAYKAAKAEYHVTAPMNTQNLRTALEGKS